MLGGIPATGATTARIAWARTLLVIGPTPPPVHGVAVTTGNLLRAAERAGVLAAHLDTRDPRTLANLGRFDLTNSRLAIVHAGQLAWMLARHRDADVYLPLSQNRWGFLRDAIFVALARLARRDVVVHLNGGYFRRFYLRSSRTEQALIRSVLRGVSQAWVLTPLHQDSFDGLIPPERVRMLENTVEDVGVNGAPFDDDGAELRVLQLANLIADKGCFDLLDAVASLGETARGIHVRFVGEVEPSVSARIAERAEALRRQGVRVELRGPRLGKAKVAEYRWADVFALPSRYPLEGQPLALLEAMSAGLPIVSTQHSGIPFTARHGREALLVRPGDITGIAEAIQRLRGDVNLRSRLARDARERYEQRYRPEVFESAFRRLVGAGLAIRG